MKQVDIKGFEDYYQITDDGRVWSKRKKRFLKPSVTPSGYCTIVLYGLNSNKPCYIHRLVAEHYIPNPNNYLEVDHINTLRNDNRTENLRWVTRKENRHNPISEKRYTERIFTEETRKKMADAKPKRKVIQYTLDGELVGEYESTIEAARQTNCSQRGIYNCCRGGYYSKERNKWKNCYQYHSFIWKFKNNVNPFLI